MVVNIVACDVATAVTAAAAAVAAVTHWCRYV